MKTPSELLRPLHHRDEIGPWLVSQGLIDRGVEVGTLYGGYAKAILQKWPGDLTCVDLWARQAREHYHDGANLLDLDAAFETFERDVRRPFAMRCSFLRMHSDAAADKFRDESLSFVYLDANHEVNHARADIRAWFPKVKIGGLFCGHDFYIRYDNDTNSDAQTAVMEFAERVDQWPQVTWCNSWWFVKTAEMAARYALQQKTEAIFKESESFFDQFERPRTAEDAAGELGDVNEGKR